MRITALLCWYLEPPEMLERCVRSLRGVADSLLAVDGAWCGMPEPKVRSTDAEYAAINRALGDTGIEGVPIRPACVWGTQVEKRAEAIRYARVLYQPDWVLVIDADEYVAQVEPGAVRALLEPQGRNVATVRVRNVTGQLAGTTRQLRRLFRATPGLTVERWHYGYRCENGWLSGDRGHIDELPAVHLHTALQIVHDDTLRSAERRAAKHDYLMFRHRERVEA